MGKPEPSVVGPAMVRPPRPAARDRSANGTPEPPATTALDSEVVVIHPSPDELAAPGAARDEPSSPEVDAAVPRRTGSLLRVHPQDAVTVPLTALAAAPIERAEPRVLELPMAALEKPSAVFDPTPSPLPRVSLTPAARDGAFEAAAPVGALNSRNVPTVAARSLVAEQPLRRPPAAAVTFPPGRAQPRDGRIRRRLAADVRSSKREIVLGLTIGMALAAALGVIGQRYLTHPSPVATRASVLATAAEPRSEPEPARPRQDWSLRPQSAAPEAPPLSVDSLKTVVEEQSAATEVAEQPRRPRVKTARNKARARASLPHGAAPSPDLFSDEPRGFADDALDEGTKPRAKAPPSPSESAGLGTDLTL